MPVRPAGELECRECQPITSTCAVEDGCIGTVMADIGGVVPRIDVGEAEE